MSSILHLSNADNYKSKYFFSKEHICGFLFTEKVTYQTCLFWRMATIV